MALAAAEVPNPAVAADRPQRGWVYRCNRAVQNDGGANVEVHMEHDEKDLRAKRKVGNGQAFLRVVNTTQDGLAS